MSDKRAEARAEARRQAKARAAATQNSTAPATEPSPEPSDDRDVTPYIRKLGYSAERARHVAALCASIPNASLEERVRFALKHLMPPHRRVPATAT
jgi:Holliday junction resolvasome RuvABC DNA-binding subunit